GPAYPRAGLAGMGQGVGLESPNGERSGMVVSGLGAPWEGEPMEGGSGTAGNLPRGRGLRPGRGTPPPGPYPWGQRMGLPARGVYVVWLWLPHGCHLPVPPPGLWLPAGLYAYTGSAQRALPARLGRHLAGGSARHWHVGYLRAEAQVVGADVWPGAPRGAGWRPASPAPSALPGSALVTAAAPATWSAGGPRGAGWPPTRRLRGSIRSSGRCFGRPPGRGRRGGPPDERADSGDPRPQPGPPGT